MSGRNKVKNERLKQLLDAEKVDKIKFTEFKSILGTIITACEFSDCDGEVLSRGLSIRSLKDGHIKKRCKNKAFGRAIKALHNKNNFYPIRNNTPLDESVVERVIKWKTPKECIACKDLLKYVVKHTSLKQGDGFRISISSLFPVMFASEFFDYKAEYKPKTLRAGVRDLAKGGWTKCLIGE